MFNEQFQSVDIWFNKWSCCEQVVALFSLLKKMRGVDIKFLMSCMKKHLIESNETHKMEQLEKEANDADYLSRMFSSKQNNKLKLTELLFDYIPLLVPGNGQAKHVYLNNLPDLMTVNGEKPDLVDELRDILSYCLIHPALSPKDKSVMRNFCSWVCPMNNYNVSSESLLQPEENNHIELKTNGYPYEWSSGSTPEQHSLSSSRDNFSIPSNQHLNRQPDRTNSYHHLPASNNIGAVGSVPTILPMLSSVQPDNYHHQQSSNHQSNQQLTMSNGVSGNGSAFYADVQVWLKSLRLHKYSELFMGMTYDEMMELTAEKLGEKNVTKGAKNKIILSIKRLKDRFSLLQNIEKEIENGTNLRASLLELKNMIYTPIQPFEPNETLSGKVRNETIHKDDIPSMYTKIMGKTLTHLWVSNCDEENLMMYTKLLERCIIHPAFNEGQKRRLGAWKLETARIKKRHKTNNMRPLNQNKNKIRSKFQSNSLYDQISRSHQGHVYHNGQQRPMGRSQFGPLASNSAPRQMSGLLGPNSTSQHPMDPSFQMWSNNTVPQPNISLMEQSRRAASLDPRLGHRIFSAFEDDTPNDLNTRLDSLCLSVAEHALADGVDGASTL